MGVRFTIAAAGDVDVQLCHLGSSSSVSGCPRASSVCSSSTGYSVYRYDGAGNMLSVDSSSCGEGTSCPDSFQVPDDERQYFDTIYAYDQDRRYFVCCEGQSSSSSG